MAKKSSRPSEPEPPKGRPMSLKSQEVLRRIHQRMREAGVSQSDLCRQTGIYGQRFSKWATGEGEITAPMIASIAEALGRPVGWFFGEAMPEDAASNFKVETEEAMLLTVLRSMPALTTLQALRTIMSAHEPGKFATGGTGEARSHKPQSPRKGRPPRNPESRVIPCDSDAQ